MAFKKHCVQYVEKAVFFGHGLFFVIEIAWPKADTLSKNPAILLDCYEFFVIIVLHPVLEAIF